MKTVIVGVGLIGGSLARDMRQTGFSKEIIGVDQNEENQTDALRLGLVDRIEKFESAMKFAELVVLAIPVNGIVKILPKVLDLIPANAVVTDMGSTKKLICDSVRNHPKRKNFVAAHPMAGTENSGPRAALSGLFANKTSVICDVDESGVREVEAVKNLFESLQMRLVYMTSKDHDLHTAFVSHLSHISSFVLANTVLDKEKNDKAIFDLAGGGFESTVRLAKSSPEMWSPIFEQNRDFILVALSAYIDRLEKFKTAIEKNAFDETHQLMQEANEIRRVLSQMNVRKS